MTKTRFFKPFTTTLTLIFSIIFLSSFTLTTSSIEKVHEGKTIKEDRITNNSKAYFAILKNPKKSGGVYYIDSFDDRAKIYDVKGYKPFYISHYGRHGARFILKESQYSNIHNVLIAAKKTGTLTEAGEEFYNKFEKIYPSLKWRAGDLTKIGERQHIEIAKRMSSNYPEIFDNNPHIEAFASTTPRTIVSMGAFMRGLQSKHSELNVNTYSGKKYMSFMNPFSKNFPGFNKWNNNIKGSKSLWYKDYIKFKKKRLNPEQFLNRYFTNLNILKKIDSLEDIEMDIFYLASNMQCIDCETEFYSMFTDKELINLWECDNYKYYVEKGPDRRSYGRGADMATTMLSEIIASAQYDISNQNSKTNVRLRFGHDGCIMALLALMKAGTWGEMIENDDEIKNVWQNWNIPMAANLQFIFYKKDSKKSDDIIFRILLNDKDLALPLKPVKVTLLLKNVKTKDTNAKFYSWNEFVKHYSSIAKEAAERLNDICKDGAPVIIEGKVTKDGLPIHNAEVSDGKHTVKTNENGIYKMYSKKEIGTISVSLPSNNNLTQIIKDTSTKMTKKLNKPAYIKEHIDFQL